MTPERRDTGPAPVGRGWAVATLLLAALALGAHLARVTWGLDRTDEGQYLLLLADPTASRQTVFLFGYVLHPLFALVGGDIAALRVLAILLSSASAGVLGWAVTRALHLRGVVAWTVGGVAAACGLGPLLYFPLTPSYNTLAFWGACLWAAGLVLLTRRDAPARPTRPVSSASSSMSSPVPSSTAAPAPDAPDLPDAHEPPAPWTARLTTSTWAGVLVGVGGVLAAAGKVTTGAALAAFTLVVLLTAVLTRRPRLGRFLLGTAVGAALTLAGVLLLVGHGPLWLVEFYREGARSVSLLQGHEHLVRWDPFPWSGFLAIPALVIVGVAVAVATGLRTQVARWVVVLAAAFALIVSDPPIGSPAMTAVSWWVPLLAALPLLTRGRGPLERRRDLPSVEPRARALAPLRLVVVGCLALTPLAYVVGTNGNYWISQGRAVVFWFAALALVLRASSVRRLATTVTAALVLVLTVSAWGYAYRYDPATEMLPDRGTTEVATVSPEGARLRLTAEDAATSRRLASLSRELHLAGVPMLDVTGASPGYIRQLGGRPVGSSWLLGGYPGSLDAALAAVRSEDPRTLDQAWILDAPESRRRIPGLLPALGRSLDRDYEEVTTFRHELGYKVRLLRPVTHR